MLTSHDAQRCITALKFHTPSATGFDPSHFDFPAQLLFLTSLSIGWHGRGFDLRGNGDGVGRLVHLQELMLIQCAGLNADFFEALRNLRELRTLTLDDCSDLDAAGFAHLSGLPELSHVSLLRSSIGASHCETLSTLPKLQVLSLEGCRMPSVTAWGDGIACLAKIPHLEDLVFSRCQGADAAAFAHLARMNCLRSLQCDVRDLPAELSKLTQLRALRLYGYDVRFTAHALHQIAQLTELAELSLEGGTVDEAGLSALSAMRGLRVLRLDCASVDAVGIQNIARIPNLHSLDLGDTRLDASSALDQAFGALTAWVHGGDLGWA